MYITSEKKFLRKAYKWPAMRQINLSHCRPFIPLPQKLFFTSDVNGLHETKDYVSCGGVILCFEVMVVTREDFLLKFAVLGQARKLA